MLDSLMLNENILNEMTLKDSYNHIDRLFPK
jgi:hypothetical protein